MEVEQNLARLAVHLDYAARRARKQMRKDNPRVLTTSASEAQHLQWLHALLREMALVISDSMGECVSPGKGSQLYVWPGYDSVIIDGRRVTFEIDRQTCADLQMLGYDGDGPEREARVIQTGLRFPHADKGIDRATLYFDAALAGMTTKGVDDAFSAGGTHNWLAANPIIGGDTPLIGFEVRTHEAPAKVDPSFPSIVLDPARPFFWGDDLASFINRECEESPESYWPLPVRLPKESKEQYSARLVSEHASPLHRSIRQRLYSLWLIGAFAEDPSALLEDVEGQRWVENLCRDLDRVEPERAQRIRGLLEVERNLAEGAALNLAPARFSNWGVLTIPFPVAAARADDSGEEDDLGSGMFLSNFDIPSWYYFAIRQWIASYYLSLRQQESAVALADRESQKAGIEAERDLRQQLSHAVGTELTYIGYLATEAHNAIHKEHFRLDLERIVNAVEAIRAAGDSGAAGVATRIRDSFGEPTPIEHHIIRLIVNGDPADSPRRIAKVVHDTLAAIPAQRSRNVIQGLIHEVSSVSQENKALVRVDDASVAVAFDRNARPARKRKDKRLVTLLGHSLVVALTTFFRKAFPPYNEAPEEVCVRACENVFGRYVDDAVTRRTKARNYAIAWRRFVASHYGDSRQIPSYAAVKRYLEQTLPSDGRLQVSLPAIDDSMALAAGSREAVPLVLQAWFTELLLNAFKHMHPGDDGKAFIAVDWETPGVLVRMRNTTTAERAQDVVRATNSDSRRTSKRGHHGLQFLRYAAQYLFPENQLQAVADPAHHLLELHVVPKGGRD